MDYLTLFSRSLCNYIRATPLRRPRRQDLRGLLREAVPLKPKNRRGSSLAGNLSARRRPCNGVFGLEATVPLCEGFSSILCSRRSPSPSSGCGDRRRPRSGRGPGGSSRPLRASRRRSICSPAGNAPCTRLSACASSSRTCRSCPSASSGFSGIWREPHASPCGDGRLPPPSLPSAASSADSTTATRQSSTTRARAEAAPRPTSPERARGLSRMSGSNKGRRCHEHEGAQGRSTET